MKCCSASTAFLAGASPLRMRGRRRASSSAAVVAALFVQREIAGEEHDLAGRAQPVAGRCRRPVSTVVRSIRADAIWLAIARFQIRS